MRGGRVVGVAVAVVGALGALLAAVVPLAFVTERRRLLRFIRDEGAVVKEIEDEEARGQLLAAIRASSLRYQELATETKAETARRHVVVALAPCYLLLVLGTGLLLGSGLLFDGASIRSARWVGGALLVMGALPQTYLFMRLQLARDEDDRIAKLRERAEYAESALDDVESTIRDYTDPEAPWLDKGTGSGEVSDLLAALQRSVDAARTARGEPLDSDGSPRSPVPH